MGNFKKLAQKRLFLPVFSMILVMLINVVYDIATGSAPLSFFMISIKNGVLYGRLIDILNRGSEIAILAIGMTLVVSASGGTDISVGSVMSLYAGVCCMILAGYGNVNVQEYAHPLLVGIGAGLLVTLICGVFNGFLVAYMNIQPMVAIFILADILFEPKQIKESEIPFEDKLRELLATKTTLNSENINQIIYFVSGLEKLQKIENL